MELKKAMELRRKMNDEKLPLGERKVARTKLLNGTVKFCLFCGKEIYNYKMFVCGKDEEFPICQKCDEYGNEK